MICTSFMCLSWINSFFTMYTPKCQWGRPTWKARQSSKCSIPRPKCRAGGIDSNWSKTFSFKSSSIYWPPPFRFSDLPLALKYYVRTPICTYMSVSLYDFTVHTHLLTYQKSKAKLICLFIWNVDYSFIFFSCFLFASCLST